MLADIFTKLYISSTFHLGESIPLIKNVFHITYHLNSGAAFSMFQDQRLFLSVLSAVIIAGIIVYLIIKKPKEKLALLAFTLVISGATGNLIDRILKGRVVDFLDFRLINFPVFNIADCFVVIGAGLLMLHILKSEEPYNEKK